ncbi:hypothetical protein PVA38_12340 [Streptococcus pneumoniae D39]|nr:hypothetical protein PVA38_12340 [Streptococcus pneumoniae D39]
MDAIHSCYCPQDRSTSQKEFLSHREFPPLLLYSCLLYTSDAADEARSVDLGGRRIIQKNIYVIHNPR